jgi:hypothetical protein
MAVQAANTSNLDGRNSSTRLGSPDILLDDRCRSAFCAIFVIPADGGVDGRDSAVARHHFDIGVVSVFVEFVI